MISYRAFRWISYLFAVIISTAGCVTQVYYITNIYSQYATVNEVIVDDEGNVAPPVVSICASPETFLLDLNSTHAHRKDEFYRLMETPRELLNNSLPVNLFRPYFNDYVEMEKVQTTVKKSFRQDKTCYDVHSNFKTSRKLLWRIYTKRNATEMLKSNGWYV